MALFFIALFFLPPHGWPGGKPTSESRGAHMKSAVQFAHTLCVPLAPGRHQNNAALKDGDIPADVVVALMEMSDALHKGSYSLQVCNALDMTRQAGCLVLLSFCMF